MRRLVVPALALLAVAGVTACSPDEADFADEAESFIEDEDGDVATQTGIVFTDAECEEPSSTETGATFACTATGDDGQAYAFTAEITGENEFLINSIEPAGATSATATSTATS